MRTLLLLPIVLLSAGASFAVAESPMPDPIAPAVVGRPLEQVKPARPARSKPAAAKPARPQKAAARPATATKVAAERPAKLALDDRADPRVQADDVGKGTHFTRKPLGPGAYIGDKHRTAVRKYYATHPVLAKAVPWQIGEPVPRGAQVKAVPSGLLASLPALPPGHQYVQLGGEVVLIAAESRMVVDGVSRGKR